MSDSKMLSDLFANANGGNGGEVVLNAQTYIIDEGVIINPLKTGLKIRGASMASTVLKCSGANGYGLWFNNPDPTHADYGLELSDLTILDSSGTGACGSLLRLTQNNDFRLSRLNLSNASGRRYCTGKASVSNGSTQVQGIGTAWTSKMAPGILWINGYPQEVASVVDATHLVLCIPWTLADTSAPYSLDYGGVALHLEGTSVDGCTQYGTVENVKAFGNRISVFAQGSMNKAGVSAVRFTGGRMGGFSGARIPNSVAAWFGNHSDTCEWNVPVNNVAFGVVIENGHQHSIINRSENDAPFCANTTGGGTKGVYVNGTAGGKVFGTWVFPQSMYGFDTGLEVNPAVSKGVFYDLRRSPYGNAVRVVGPVVGVS